MMDELMKQSQRYSIGEVVFSDKMAEQLGVPKRMPVVEAEMSVELQRTLNVVTVKFPILPPDD
jgi:hypothetical protein